MLRAAAILIGAALACAPAAAQSLSSLHRLFEDRCGRCHGHMGDLARERLDLVDGVASSRLPGRDLSVFLSRHSGGLPPEKIAPMISEFSAQLQAGGAYKRRCAICHDPAEKLARLRLVTRDGHILGRYTGRDIAAFMPGHGRHTEEELTAIMERLRAFSPVLD